MALFVQHTPGVPVSRRRVLTKGPLCPQCLLHLECLDYQEHSSCLPPPRRRLDRARNKTVLTREIASSLETDSSLAS
jgi:hypothetical protein